MSDMNSTHNRIVWADIPASNLPRAAAFYAAILNKDVPTDSFNGADFAIIDHDQGNGGCGTPTITRVDNYTMSDGQTYSRRRVTSGGTTTTTVAKKTSTAKKAPKTTAKAVKTTKTATKKVATKKIAAKKATTKKAPAKTAVRSTPRAKTVIPTPTPNAISRSARGSLAQPQRMSAMAMGAWNKASASLSSQRPTRGSW